MAACCGSWPRENSQARRETRPSLHAHSAMSTLSLPGFVEEGRVQPESDGLWFDAKSVEKRVDLACCWPSELISTFPHVCALFDVVSGSVHGSLANLS